MPYNQKTACYIIIFILLLVASIVPAISQPQPGPCFTADITRGCAPLTINVTNCSSDGAQIGYDFGNGVFTNATTFTYDTPGKYTIRQIGNFTSSNGGDTLTRVDYIEVLATPVPAFLLSTCQGRTVEVNITDNSYDTYLVDFGDGTSESTSPGNVVRRTYPDVAQRTIRVTGQHITQPSGLACAGNYAEQTITPIQELIKPVINSLNARDELALDLSFTASNYLSYRILQKTGRNGAYQDIAYITNPANTPFEFLISDIDLSNELYTFQVIAVDVCGNELASDEISSLKLSTRAVNNENIISWEVIENPLLQNFTVYRDNQVIAQITSATQRSYTDRGVRCPNEYCYQVVARYSTNAESASAQSCVRAISNSPPQAIYYMTASVEDGFAALNWAPPSGEEIQEFTILRSDNGGDFRELARTTDTTFLDNRGNPITPANTYCYKIEYTNACGNSSGPGISACPMLLTKNTDGTTTQLNWTAYTEWPTGVKEYVLEKLDSQGNIYDSQSAGTGLSVSFNGAIIDTTQQVLRFRVKANPTLSFLRPATSTVVEVVQPVQIHLPDAFTPNSDGLNDTFGTKGLFINEYTLRIYNRWGEVVFQSLSLQEQWDGQYNNEEAPAGKYVYNVTVRDFTGRNHNKNGTVYLIR